MTDGKSKKSSVPYNRRKPYPEPEMPAPDMNEIMRESLINGISTATDGCTVEPDGRCSHGHPSWLLYWGMI